MLRRGLLSSLVVFATLTGCNHALTPENSDAVGTLLSRDAASQNGEYRLRIYNLTVSPDDGATEIYLLATERTPVYIRESDGSFKRASVLDLRPGAHILARIGGVVLKSNPAQYGASRIDAEQDLVYPDNSR